MYKNLLRPILFLLQPEAIHHVVFFLFKLVRNIPFGVWLIKKYYSKYNNKPFELWGIEFKNRVGLAAGLDKNADAFDMFDALGFGFVEIGTVTPVSQPGNPKPRIFRLKKDQALINRMGFNNKGAENAAQNLKRRKGNIIIGGNIGKNKVTPNEQAVNDYLLGFATLYPVVDYFVINVSSPNTPNLRELQEREPLKVILTAIMEANKAKEKQKPVLLKIAPDLSFEQIDIIIELVAETGLNGLVVNNTTISRENLSYSKEFIEKIGAGGLSGKPLGKRSNEIIKYIADKTGGSIPIIGSGGIMSEADAKAKLEAGASLVQLYTGFIYEGPGLIREINKSI
ncbi:MAG TPA: dihydroorotate dehydrogenase (quinone) [Bacteroidales bacterium]|nr:dihydroorotate dehydrogenase (quinone) [Bacteroidales bacterium]